MYLGTRLNKFDISDWQGKIPGSKQKWWECFVEDLSVELMEGGFSVMIVSEMYTLYTPYSPLLLSKLKLGYTGYKISSF